MDTEAVLELFRSYGFPAYYLMDASLAPDAPAGVSALLLLIRPYGSWGHAQERAVWISAYYFAAQSAYLAAKELAARLTAMGETAQLCNEVRIKPLLSRLPDFAQGRNTLHYHKDFGSRFHVQLLGLQAPHLMSKPLRAPDDVPDMCAECRKCMKACPTGAITEQGFDRGKCLRQHMLRGTPVPEDLRVLMGCRLVGCDICQQVCPANSHLPDAPDQGEPFLILSLLQRDPQVLKRLREKIGRNLALPARVLSQACLAAGNSGDLSYLPMLAKLMDHPSATVACHAAWAAEKLTHKAGRATL